jgi:hypothetical protein
MNEYIPLAKETPDPGYYWTLRIVNVWYEGAIKHITYRPEWRRWDGERWSGEDEQPSHWYRVGR